MALISVILTLLIERYLGSLREFRDYRWFERFTDRFRELIPELARRPLVSVILLLLLPTLAMALICMLLDGIWALFGFAFALAVLLYAYGCQDLEPQIDAFIDARLRGDEEAARFHLRAMVQGEIPADARVLNRTLMETALVELNDRLLAVIFWFALLGPAGALVFRLASLLRSRFQHDTSGLGAAAGRVYHWLTWAPVRLTAMSYALMGNFTESVRQRREEAAHWSDEHRGILVASGLGALQYSVAEPASRVDEIAELRATIELMRRVILAWVVVLGVLVVVSASVSWLLG